MKDIFQADFGASLKAAREAAKLTTTDVAAKLKLTARQIESLEQEEFEHLPSEIFVRGFVKNYARLVGLDPDSLIAPVDAQAAVSETITAPNAGLNVGSSGIRLWLVYPLVAMTVFLMLVAGLYYWLRQGENTLLTSPQEMQTQPEHYAAEYPPVPGIVAPAETTPVDGATDIPATPDAEVLPPVDPVLPANAAPATTNIAVSPVVAAKPTEPQVTATAPNVDAVRPSVDANARSGLRNMRFEPSQDAWIQVVDGKGSHFSKLVRAGTSESFAGVPPFRLVVGEAALVKLTYNGHSIDLKPFIGQKVARLTLE